MGNGSRSVTSISRPTRHSGWRTGNRTNGEVGKFNLYNGTIELATIHVGHGLVSGRRVNKLQSSFSSVLPRFYEGWKVDSGYVPIEAENSFEVGFDNIAS